MSKQIISKSQLFTMTALAACGFLVPLLSYEYISGIDYLQIVFFAELAVLVLMRFFRPLYVNGGIMPEQESSSFNRFTAFAVMIFLWVILYLNFYTSIDFWSIYDYRRNSFFFYALFILISVWLCSYWGIEVSARLALWLFVIFAFVLLLNSFLLFPQMNIERLLPLHDGWDMEDIRQLAMIISLFLPACLLALLYAKRIRNKPAPKYIALAVAAGMLIIFLIISRTILVLGNTCRLYAYPLIQTLKMIQFPGALAGVELFGLLAIMSFCLSYMIIMNCMIADILQSLFRRLPRAICCIIPAGTIFAIYFAFAGITTDVLQPYHAIVVIASAAVMLFLLIIRNFFAMKAGKRFKTLK